MGDIYIDDIERQTAGFDTPYAAGVLSLVNEVRSRRQTAERELRHHIRMCEQIGSLKRRITELRRGFASLAGGNCLSEVEEYKRACADELAADTARRRRFEKKQKAARHG